jgi:hypothetical protein
MLGSVGAPFHPRLQLRRKLLEFWRLKVTTLRLGIVDALCSLECLLDYIRRWDGRATLCGTWTNRF